MQNLVGLNNKLNLVGDYEEGDNNNVNMEEKQFFRDLKRGDRILCSKIDSRNYRIEKFLTIEKLIADFQANQGI